ncbi:MAG: hypothetical protein LBC20_03985 [Planctomycetaceae bacterium]|jgi:hypothetical protein|nr:hypothetical protein [Planctomycetaceae bacterium]
MKYLRYVLAFVIVSSLFVFADEPRWQNGTLCFENNVVGKLSGEMTGGIAVASETLTALDDNTFKIVRTYKAENDVNNAQICFDYVHNEKANWWMIPSVSYNGNQWGRGKEPKGATENGHWRTFSYRRTSIPGATYSEGDRFAVAMWSDTPTSEYHDFSCSLAPEESQTTHRILWPEEELPTMYSGRDHYADGYKKKIHLKKGDTVTLTLYLVVNTVEPDHQAIHHFLRKAWEYAEKPVIPVFDTQKLWELGIRYAAESLWAEEGSFKGFSIGLVADGEKGWKQRSGGKYEIGWCGQNASLANSLLTDYIKHRHTESLNKALTALDTWANNCPLPNGLFITRYDNILTNGDIGVMDACNLGTAALNFFEARDLTRTAGLDRPLYERIARNICDFVKADQQPEGVYARGWTPDGKCYIREGTIGCFMVPPMLEAYRRSGDSAYLVSATKAYDYYLKALKTDGYTTAGALDTWCIDKESSMPLLRASLMLYEITSDSVYLDNAISVSYYLSTWLWHYQGIYPENDNFTVYRYNTFGATSVSTQHHHLDPYALFWVSDWIKLADLTGDNQWKEKALAVWRNGCQLVSDGTLEINGRIRPAGSQNEAYFECNFAFGTDAKRINSWLVAWPGAFRLETLRRLNDFQLLNSVHPTD